MIPNRPYHKMSYYNQTTPHLSPTTQKSKEKENIIKVPRKNKTLLRPPKDIIPNRRFKVTSNKYMGY